MTNHVCSVDLSMMANEIDLDVSASTIELTVAASEIALEVSANEIGLDLAASEINLALAPMGLQGPPGAGSTFSSTNKEGVSVSAGAPVATHSTGVGVVLADATTSAKPCVGLATMTAADLAAVTVQSSGPYTLADWTDVTGAEELEPKATYYLDTTPGKLTTLSPDSSPGICQRVGVAVSPTVLEICSCGFVQL